MRRTRLAGLLGAAACIASSLTARGALANGRFPNANQIVFSPSNPNLIIGRATYAILPSTDNGHTWGYLCEGALDLPTGTSSFEDPELGLTAGGALVAGLSSPTAGLSVSNDLGCNWTCVGPPLSGQPVADTVVRPDLPHQVLALASTGTDAGMASQVFQSMNDGATWTAMGSPLDPSATVTSLDVPSGDPNRIYVTGNIGFGSQKTAWLYVSTDGGGHWAAHSITTGAGGGFDPTLEDQIFIAGIDPTNEDRVYLRSASIPQADFGASRLYVTTDAGQSFTMAKNFYITDAGTSEFLLQGEMLGFAQSSDGSKIFVGTINLPHNTLTGVNGLWMAGRDMSFTMVNAGLDVRCLAVRQTSAGDELWACSDEFAPSPADGFTFGVSTDYGVTFTPRMKTLSSLSGPVVCPSGGGPSSFACNADANTAAACSCTDYTMQCMSLELNYACLGCGLTPADDGGPAPPNPGDAGANDGSISDAGNGGATGTHHSSSSCGCSTTGGGGAAALLFGWPLVAVAVRRRRSSCRTPYRTERTYTSGTRRRYPPFR